MIMMIRVVTFPVGVFGFQQGSTNNNYKVSPSRSSFEFLSMRIEIKIYRYSYIDIEERYRNTLHWLVCLPSNECPVVDPNQTL